jgi:DNA modification methylase
MRGRRFRQLYRLTRLSDRLRRSLRTRPHAAQSHRLDENKRRYGSLYRSQHELLPLFKKGDAPHINNIELGKKGRWRSNVWNYPGASSRGSDARRGLKDQPTVKPTAMLEDALLDLTNRGDTVVDPFLGSGSTLVAAEKTGRVCRGVEIDPLYADVIMRRYEAATGDAATLIQTGETLEALGVRRRQETEPA